jgi:hypothetical protein
MSRNADLEYYFGWLVDELKQQKVLCKRTIIYCQTIKQCGLLYATLKGILGKDMYGNDGDFKDCLLEMLHSCTPKANKENIINSFTNEQGVIRVLVATISFGMGVNCKAVERIIHFGPSKNIENYIQETGRAGRNGAQAVAFLLYNGILLNHVESDIKSYVIKDDKCRRKALLMHFEEDPTTQQVLHLCCDYCASKCECGTPECGKFTTFPLDESVTEPESKLRSRDATSQQIELVHKQLTLYHKKIVTDLLNTTAKTDLRTLTGIPLLLGFSDIQIQQVVDNIEHIFTISDICCFVEIWDMTHAHKILCIIRDVFQDVPDQDYTEDNKLMDDTWVIEDWEYVLEDDELLDMAVANISLSQFDESSSEHDGNLSNDFLNTSIPDAVLKTLDEMDLSAA